MYFTATIVAATIKLRIILKLVVFSRPHPQRIRILSH